MGSSILQRWKQKPVPTEWQRARKVYGVVWLIEEVFSSPLALAVGGQGVYGHSRRYLNEYGHIRHVEVEWSEEELDECFRIIVQSNDDSGKRVWEWGYDRYETSESVPLSKNWVRGIASTCAQAKELADASLSEWASTIARTRDPVYPACQDLAEWVSLFETCEDLDESGHPSLNTADHDHYRALVQYRLGGAERSLGVAQGFCDVGRDREKASDYPLYLTYKQGTWEDVAQHYIKEIANINGGLQIIAKIISKITNLLSISRDDELKKNGIKVGEWPDLSVIEGFSYRQARIQRDRDLCARHLARDIKDDGVGSDEHRRALQYMQGKQDELDRVNRVFLEVCGLPSAQD